MWISQYYELAKIQSLIKTEWCYAFYTYEQTKSPFSTSMSQQEFTSSPGKQWTSPFSLVINDQCSLQGAVKLPCWASNKSCLAPSRHNARCQRDIPPTSRWPCADTAGRASKDIQIQQICRYRYRNRYRYVNVYMYVYVYMCM